MEPLPDNPSSIEDFLENDAFRTWVRERRSEDRIRWQQWLDQHPDQRDCYEQAVATFLVLQGKQVDLTEGQVIDKTAHIINQLNNPFNERPLLINWQWGRWVSVAAAIALMAFWQFGKPTPHSFPKISFWKSQPVRKDEWKIVKNVSGQSLVVLLPDNSSVLLATGSQLRFQKSTRHALREVFLQGDGFFEVTKNPAKPFIVHTNRLTTRVLGTSFQVRSFDQEAMAFVKVKTGRVSVFPAQTTEKPILLTVNEELTLESKTKQLVKSNHFLAEENADDIIAQPFKYNYTAIPAIFDGLEASYHMPIQYDRSLLSHCTFTGQLDDMPFLEKIRLICLTIESTYEVVDNQVIIHSRGCL